MTPQQAVLWRVREMPASWKAAWDALTHRRPVFLGHPEDGVRTALAGPTNGSGPKSSADPSTTGPSSSPSPGPSATSS